MYKFYLVLNFFVKQSALRLRKDCKAKLTCFIIKNYLQYDWSVRIISLEFFSFHFNFFHFRKVRKGNVCIPVFRLNP